MSDRIFYILPFKEKRFIIPTHNNAIKNIVFVKTSCCKRKCPKLKNKLSLNQIMVIHKWNNVSYNHDFYGKKS